MKNLFSHNPVCSILAVLAVLAFSSRTVASVVVDFNDLSTTFNTTGQLQGQAGGSGLSGTWAGNVNNGIVAGDLSGPVGSASLIYSQSTGPGLAPQKYESNINGTASFADSNTYRSLADPMSGEVWFSFLVQASGPNIRIALGLNPTNVNALTDSDMTAWRSPDAVRVYGPGTTPSFIRGVETGVTATDLFLVGRVNTTNTTDNVDLWINPTESSDFNNPATIPNADIDFTDNQLSSIGVVGYNGSYFLDNIRLGSTLSDVAYVVPEPGTMTLLFVGCGLLIWFRRIMYAHRTN